MIARGEEKDRSQRQKWKGSVVCACASEIRGDHPPECAVVNIQITPHRPLWRSLVSHHTGHATATATRTLDNERPQREETRQSTVLMKLEARLCVECKHKFVQPDRQPDKQANKQTNKDRLLRRKA